MSRTSRWSRTRTVLLMIAGAILAGWLIPPFFHAGRYRKLLESTLENRLGRRVAFGAITLRLLPHPGFSIQNVVVYENPGFGPEPFARVDEAECDLRWRSLWGSRLDCSRIVLRHPVVNAVRDGQGEWNVEQFFRRGSVGEKVKAAGSRQASEPFGLEISAGRVNFTMDGVKKPFALDGVDAALTFDPAQRSVRFRVQGAPLRTDLSLQPPGPVSFSGEWKPATGSDGAFHARLTASGSLLSGWIPLILHYDPGVYGLVDADLRLEGSTHHIKAAGEMRISQLHLRDSLPPSSDAPVNLSFAASWNRDQHSVMMQRVDAAFGQSRMNLSGEVMQISGSPRLDLTLALKRCRLNDLVALANRLARHPSSVRADGRVAGSLTIQGPWRERRFGGALNLASLRLRGHNLNFFSQRAVIRVDGRRADLLPTHFISDSGVEGIAEATVSLPVGSALHDHDLPARQAAAPHYDLSLTLKKASLRKCLVSARRAGVRHLRDLNATGFIDATVRLSGAAWPFSRPRITAEGDLQSASLLVAGLTEPVRFNAFHFQLAHGVFLAMPVAAQIGDARFSGWLRHGPAHDAPWRFEARAPHLVLEKASLWFAVLGYRKPMPILDLIPGLRSFAGRSTAGRNVFAALNAQGSFQCPEVTFRSLDLDEFQARLTLADRVASLSHATFKIEGGNGSGAAKTDFKESPARTEARFSVSGLKLQRLAAKLPPALSGLRGALYAAGNLTTRGLARHEMAANLSGKVAVRLRNVEFGSFDPLEAAAHAASIGVLAPGRDLDIAAIDANLSIMNRIISLSPAHILLAGAALRLAGTYTFNGIGDFIVHADMAHIHRPWLSAAGVTTRRAATLRLTGPLNNLTVTPAVETAQTHE